jgi:hypothetical protein
MRNVLTELEQKMKDLTLYLLLALMIPSVAAFAQDSKGTGAKIIVEETSFDFGYVPGGEVVSHSYFFLSGGTDSLKILNVKPGCGCTKAPLKKDVVAAGDSAEVELIFTSSRGGHGAVSKSAMVTCNDPDRNTFQITFNGKTYDKPDALMPLALSDGTIKWDDRSRKDEAKLVVKNVSETNLKIRLISEPFGYLKIDIPDSEIKPGKEKEIKVKVGPSVGNEEFRKSFTFAVDDSANTRYTVPVALYRGTLVPEIQSAASKKLSSASPDTNTKGK